jgi:hypothetical protein
MQQACHLLLGNPQNSINNVLHNTTAKKCSFQYKTTIKAMIAAEILEVDRQMVEKRKNEPFSKGWFVSDVATLLSKSELLQKGLNFGGCTKLPLFG